MIDITTPAIIFPAISLLLLAYTNKFLAISSIIRQLSSNARQNLDTNLLHQIENLRFRINLLKVTQATGLLSIVSCLISMIFLFFSFQSVGHIFFILSIFWMMVSLIFAFVETVLSGSALKIELEKLKKKK